jgi:hypothetical protein
VLYDIFKADFLDSKPSFEGKQVAIRSYQENSNNEAFIHITHQDYNKDCERLPDIRRYERIR